MSLKQLKHGDAVRCGSLWIRFLDTGGYQSPAPDLSSGHAGRVQPSIPGQHSAAGMGQRSGRTAHIPPDGGDGYASGPARPQVARGECNVRHGVFGEPRAEDIVEYVRREDLLHPPGGVHPPRLGGDDREGQGLERLDRQAEVAAHALADARHPTEIVSLADQELAGSADAPTGGGVLNTGGIILVAQLAQDCSDGEVTPVAGHVVAPDDIGNLVVVGNDATTNRLLVRDDYYYRLLANKAPVMLYWRHLRNVPEAHTKITRANKDYNAVVADMVHRRTMHGDRGVEWTNPDGDTRIVFAYRSFRIPCSKDVTVHNITMGRLEPLNDDGFQANPHHTYRLTPK